MVKNRVRRQSSKPKLPLPQKKQVLLLIESSRACGNGLIAGISQYARQHNNWIIRIDEDQISSEPAVQRIKNWQGDGIISRTFSKEVYRALVRHPCPVVELCGDGTVFFADLRNDNEKIAKLAVQHAREQGYTRFAFYSFGDVEWAKERSMFFQRDLKKLGFSCEELHQHLKQRDNVHPLWHRCFEPKLKAWLCSLPFPIFLWTASDVQALRVLAACLDRGIRVPEDIAILGTDNDSLLCNALTPSLSSIRTDPVRIGVEAARLLDARMRGESLNTEPMKIPPLGIACRQSTNFLSIDDADVVSAMQLIREQAIYGIRVSDVAQQVALSQNTLCRRFQRFLGRTPEQEILRIRIERAKELLCFPEMSVEQIAQQTGFGATEYFMKVFLRKTGLTPYRYRKQCQQTSEFV
jgi:LacI family transcriptional regulator